jgi:hypothetical protein
MTRADLAAAEAELSRARAELSVVTDAAAQGPVDASDLACAEAALTAATIRLDATDKAHKDAQKTREVLRAKQKVDSVHADSEHRVAAVSDALDRFRRAATDLDGATRAEVQAVEVTLKELANIDPASTGGRLEVGFGRVVVDRRPVRSVAPQVGIEVARVTADLLALSSDLAALADRVRRAGSYGNGWETVRPAPASNQAVAA